MIVLDGHTTSLPNATTAVQHKRHQGNVKRFAPRAAQGEFSELEVHKGAQLLKTTYCWNSWWKIAAVKYANMLSRLYSMPQNNAKCPKKKNNYISPAR
jgi:hypothetical protein